MRENGRRLGRRVVSFLLSIVMVFSASFVMVPEVASAEEVNIKYNYTGVIETWIVPFSGNYIITAVGAGGADGEGGNGALVKGKFCLTKGQEINIAVGEQGHIGSYGGCGGGGGSFVVNYTTNTPLLIAGGGSGTLGHDGTITPTGSGYGGSGGIGSGTNSSGGGGGGGYLSFGQNGASNGQTGGGGGGLGYNNGLQGGSGGNSSLGRTGGRGGFGGGGGGSGLWSNSDSAGNGGGGGYSGGNGSGGGTVGSGGTSYNAGSNQYNVPGYNSSNGYVTITGTYIAYDPTIAPVTSPTANSTFISAMSINGTVSETNAGDILKVYARLDGYNLGQVGKSIKASGGNDSYSGNVSLSSVPSGSHTLYVWVEDSSGSMSSEVSVTPITVNSTQDVNISAPSLQNPAIVVAGISFTLYISGEISGTDSWSVPGDPNTYTGKVTVTPVIGKGYTMITGTFDSSGVKIGTIGTSGVKLFINAISPPISDTITSVSFIE